MVKYMAKNTNFLPFKEAREFMHKQNLRSQEEWMQWSKTKRPTYIPSTPLRVYKDNGWNGLEDWLGYKRFQLLSFEEATKFMHKQNLNNRKEWDKWKNSKRPKFIPSNPNVFYKDKGWSGLELWLGYKRSPFLPFKKARKFMHKQSLVGQKEWSKWNNTKRPSCIPSTPSTYYKNDGWISLPDWLGYKKHLSRPILHSHLCNV